MEKEEQLVLKQIEEKGAPLELFEHRVIEIRLRAAAFYDSEDWLQALADDAGLAETEVVDFFNSLNPSLRISCILENFINKSTTSL